MNKKTNHNSICRWMKGSAMAILAACSLSACQDSDFELTEDTATPYEADIRYIILDDTSIMRQPQDSIKTVIGNSNITVLTKEGADITAITPKFVLTKGAHIYAMDEDGKWTIDADGLTRDFSQGTQAYMVESENKTSHKIFYLQFTDKEFPLVNHFEIFELNDSTMEEDGSTWFKKVPHYFQWLDYKGQNTPTWSTANGGFAMLHRDFAPEKYPTSPCEGVEGMGVKLVTSKTGGMATAMGKDLAAGSLFIGYMNVATAVKNPLESTKFGYPFANKPLAVSGWMSYKPGEKYQNGYGKDVAGAVDSCSISAVLYRNVDENGKEVMLDGATISNSPYIVAKAELTPAECAGTNGEWKQFRIVFNYDDYTQPFDPAIMRKNGYNLTVTCSSSSKGDFFLGAEGSTLKIDEIVIECDENIK